MEIQSENASLDVQRQDVRRERSNFYDKETVRLGQAFFHSKNVWLIVVCFVFGLSFWLGTFFGREVQQEEVRRLNLYISLAAGFWFLVLSFGLGLFERYNRINASHFVPLILLISLGSTALGLFLTYFIFYAQIGRLAIGYGFLVGTSSALLVHFTLSYLIKRNPLNVLLLGEVSPVSNKIKALLKHKKYSKGYRLFHLNSKDLEKNKKIIYEKISALNISSVVVTEKARSCDTLSNKLIYIIQQGVHLISEEHFYSSLSSRYPVFQNKNYWLFNNDFNKSSPFTDVTLRCFDILVSIGLLVFLFPVFVILSLGVHMSDKEREGIFFIQLRMGYRQRPFNIYKFRTMKKKQGLRDLYTRRNDPRITTFGKIIRSLHLDELPQLVNILKGEMSFVGPRPEGLSIARNKGLNFPLYHLRHSVRPGLTGLAQVSQGKTGVGDNEILKKLSFDLNYVKKRGILLNIQIIFRTFSAYFRMSW